MAAIRQGKEPASCEGCYAWGQLPGRFCRACLCYAQNHATGVCNGCRRSVTVDQVHGYCRLCRAQATWAILASGKSGQVVAPYLAQIREAQLWLAHMQRPPHVGPRVGKAGRAHLRKSPAPAPTPQPLPGWVQLELFPGVRDLDRFDRRRDANLTNPALVRARHEARTVGEARGWAKVMAGNVDRALVIALSGHTQGELISHSQLFPTLRRRGLSIARTVEILDRLGLFTDDRIPSFDTWLAGKLSDLAPGIGIVVEGWARQLHDGGPRNRRHPQNTIWGYLGRVHPTLLAWSGRYDDLREVTRADVIGARDNAQGKDRETLLVVLRSLFSYAKKTGKVFANPTVHVHVPRPVGGVLQPLAQTDIDEAIEVAVKPHIRLIIALAAVHAARPCAIRSILLDDVDLPNRRISIANHIRPLDDLTNRALTEWLDHRRQRWPNTANPHLLVTQQTAGGLGRASGNWVTEPTRNLTATLERLRVDRLFDEVLTHGPDPLHLAAVFGISEKTAIRYATSAKQILTTPIEHQPASSPRTQGPTPAKTTPEPLGSR